MATSLRPATASTRIYHKGMVARAAMSRSLRLAEWAGRVGRRYGIRGSAWDSLPATVRAVPSQPGTLQNVTQSNVHLSVTAHGGPVSVSYPLSLTLRLAIPTARRAISSAPVAGPPASQTVMAPAQALPLARILAGSAIRQDTTGARQGILPAQARTNAMPVTSALHVAASERRPISVKGSVPLEAPPVQRMISRPAVSAVVPVPQAAPPVPFVPPTLRYWGEAPAPPVPQLDVERLTDQVIRSIDQRVVAARERMGKG